MQKQRALLQTNSAFGKYKHQIPVDEQENADGICKEEVN